MNQIQQRKIIMNCINCKLSFTKSHYESEQICSRRCHDEYIKRLNTIVKSCPICNEEFKSDRRKNRIVCSKVCANKFQRTAEVLERKQIKTKKSLMEKYGVEHNSQITGFREKVKSTKLKRYGDSNYTNKEKAKQTLIEKYGDSSYNNKEKTKNTILKKYGVVSFSQSPLFKQRLAEKYGVNHPMLIQKNKQASFKKVLSKLTEVTPLFDFETYIGISHTNRYKFKCNSCGNEFESNLDNGHIPICRVCHPVNISKSKYEFEIIEWLRNIYDGEIIHGDRNILNGKELDIYLPAINMAIELNGLYYHGEVSGGKSKKYHLNKTKWCTERGITLIHILDIEWINKKEIVKSILLNKINSEKIESIHGRKCTLREIPAKISNEFLNKNHIQGEDKSSVRIGLYHNDELVSVLTFGKNRFSNETEWEMYRFCNKVGFNVRGSLEKLFKYFVNEYQPNNIVSFADRRYFTGESYRRLNFNIHSVTSPNYHYFKINNNKTIFSSRNKFQKHKLKKLLKVYDSTITEWSNMQLNGFDRIWDCGNTKWIWSANKKK